MQQKKVITYIVLPLSIVAIIIVVLIYNANRILKYEFENLIGKGFAAETIELDWGSVHAKKVGLVRPDGKKVLSVDDLLFRADFIGLLKKENIISGLKLHSPYLLLETDRRGEIVFPLPPEKSKKEKAGPPGKGFLIKELEIKECALDYVDRKVEGGPAFIRLRNVALDMENIAVPAENTASDYELSATLPGKTGNGSLKSKGTINLKTRDTKAKLHVKNLDITLLKPYYHKKNDVDVTKGLLGLDADISIVNSNMHSTGKIIIKDLEFVSNKGTFLGLPLLAVTKLIKDSNNEIELDFTLEGDMKNPKFNIMGSLFQKIRLSLAKTLGLPLESIGRSVFDFGAETFKKIFK
ncbi:MAG: DUF748 domain-containing protein [Nitrospiraceae bacterium]|nr:MAG: DUF748 domain-containing protein [Nitrospiraceae bacterium]